MLTATANCTSLTQACPFPVSGRPAEMATLSWGTSHSIRYWCQDVLCGGRLDRSRLPTRSACSSHHGSKSGQARPASAAAATPRTNKQIRTIQPLSWLLSWRTERGVPPGCRMPCISWAFPAPGPVRQRLTEPLSLRSCPWLPPRKDLAHGSPSLRGKVVKSSCKVAQ